MLRMILWCFILGWVFSPTLSHAQNCDSSQARVDADIAQCNRNWSESCRFELFFLDHSPEMVSLNDCLGTERLQERLDLLRLQELKQISLSPEGQGERMRSLVSDLKSPQSLQQARTILGDALTNQEKNSCKPFDYRPRLPPVRDQSDMGWCYGFSAADLLSFKTQRDISAADLSLSNFYSPAVQALQGNVGGSSPAAQSQSGSNLHGGAVLYVLEGARRGVCLESNFPSQDFKLGEDYVSLQEALSSLEGYAGRPTQSLDADSQEELSSLVSQMAPNRTNEALAAVASASSQRVVNTVRRIACSPKTPIRFGPVRNHISEDSTFLLNKIRSVFESGNIASITYNVDVLENPEASVASINDENAHSSSVVGQRWNKEKKQCELLLRNSWGPYCDYYHASYECSEGHVWIPTKTLTGATEEVVYIE